MASTMAGVPISTHSVACRCGNGLAVLEALRADERTRQVPVVILSNYSERELVERGLKLGALEYLIKSQTTPAKLAGGVENWLKG